MKLELRHHERRLCEMLSLALGFREQGPEGSGTLPEDVKGEGVRIPGACREDVDLVAGRETVGYCLSTLK